MVIGAIYKLQLELIQLSKLETSGKVAYAIIKNAKKLEEILKKGQGAADAINEKYLTKGEDGKWKMDAEKLYFASPDAQENYYVALSEMDKEEHDVTLHKIKETDLGGFTVKPSDFVEFFTQIVE